MKRSGLQKEQVNLLQKKFYEIDSWYEGVIVMVNGVRSGKGKVEISSNTVWLNWNGKIFLLFCLNLMSWQDFFLLKVKMAKVHRAVQDLKNIKLLFII
jgi:hypothetical protein